MRQFFLLFFISLFFAASGLFFDRPAKAEMFEIMDDQELADIQARGFYFRLDLSLEAFTDASTAPQVVINETDPFIREYGTPDGGGPGGGGGNINLSGNAQGNLSALINIIGANSVINVGLNIINIQNSAGDQIYLTNLNSGTMANLTSVP